jgi:D-xylose transport system permease protein
MTAPMNLAARLDFDGRLLGIVASLAAIWVGFHIASDGLFITPRNLYNLSLQTASVAIMAIGMVPVIVIRQIDLSVGSVLGVAAMIMGIVQADWLPPVFGLGSAAIWPVTVAAGILVGAIIGGFQGWIVGYLGVPSFVVTLGGLLVWRGAAWWVTHGQTVAPLDERFSLIGGGVYGTIGAAASWAMAGLAVIGLAVAAFSRRRRLKQFGFELRPVWAEILAFAIRCALVLGFVATMNAYDMPAIAAQRLADARGFVLPKGATLAEGIPIPVLIVVGLALVATVVLQRTRFGRYLFAMGGNPEAAERAGIDIARMTMLVLMTMGALAGLSASIASARLQSAGNALGTSDELRVIAAAVIGGTSLAGGIGSVWGAILGALVIQSLQSGMALLGFDSSLQNIVTGIVLVAAVFADGLYLKLRKGVR